MNYIILSDRVSGILEEKYRSLAEEYGYTGNLDGYIQGLLSFDGQFKLYARCLENREYQLIGRQCRLFIETDRKYPDWLYARRFAFFETEEEYCSKLAQTIDLPGEWAAVPRRESSGLPVGRITPVRELLDGLKPDYREFYDFRGKWSTWDLYNSKLKEYEERQEAESEISVRSVVLEGNVFTLKCNNLPECYKEDGSLCILTEGRDRFSYLGRISGVKKGTREVEVPCDDHDFVLACKEGVNGKIIKARIVDFGAKARISRQDKAMKRLFQGEAANPALREILSGEYAWEEGPSAEVSMEDTVSMFGSNVRQKEAYVGAVNAPDLFMIQGPPGTGKTTIIIELVRHAIEAGQKVLVSSETNIAVDNVLERICRTENVIPVRLGRAERIDESCRKYRPEEIADTILRRVREENRFLDEQGVNEQALVDKCESRWRQREEAAAMEIRKLKERLNTREEDEKLLDRIIKFESLVMEINEQYEQIRASEREYFTGKSRLSKLEARKANIEERLLLLGSTVMSSGFTRQAGTEDGKKDALLNELKAVEEEIAKSRLLLSGNRYEAMTASYRRKNRRFDRSRAELDRLLPEGGSVLARAHQARVILEDIAILMKQSEHIRAAREAEVKEVREDCIRKRKLWEMSRDIRSGWVSATEEPDVRRDIESIYMSRTNVVFATCTGIASAENGSFAETDYDYVIIDEAAKCSLLDLLIPVTMGKKIILVGDHKQLYPMLDTESVKGEMSEEQIQELKEHIIFKWLYEGNIPEQFKIMLRSQYRMEKNISEFVSRRFYGGQLICEKDTEHSGSMVWVDCEDSREERKDTSFRNPNEAEVVVSLLRKLDGRYRKGTSVGIICTYKAQADYIRSLLAGYSWNNVEAECSTVDAFQGKEKHTIIFNSVRSHKLSAFAREENRVNVAVSRAQEYLYVVGSAALAKNGRAGVLRDLYEYIRLHGELRSSRYVR